MAPRSKRVFYITLAGVLLVLALLPIVWNWSSGSAESDDSLGLTNYLEQLKSERQLIGKQTPELPEKVALPEVERASAESANAQPLESSQSGKPSAAGSAASEDATDEPRANPVQMLLASPELWPSEVTLAHDTEFPAVLNGKVVGKVKVNAGVKVGLAAVESDSVEVEFRGGKVRLPHKDTDLLQVAGALEANPDRTSEGSTSIQRGAPQDSPLAQPEQADRIAAAASQKNDLGNIRLVPSIDQIQYPVTEDILEIAVPEELANPNAFNSKVGRTVPVVIVNMLHAQADGLHANNLKKSDGSRDPRIQNFSTASETLLLSEMSQWHLYQHILGKLAVEESSRFRGYCDPASAPYIGIQVVKYFNLYANFPVPEDGVTAWGGADKNMSPDFHEIFERIGLKRLVEEQGVKEVWFNTHASMPESNMASPVTGDVSNSHRVSNDLPIYERTYIVYAYPTNVGVDNFLHCRSHQYEAMLKYMNRDFFRNQFVFGGDGEINAGNCHWTANAKKDPSGKSREGYHHYFYHNPDYVESSIETWIPYTKTETKKINASYWGSRSSRSLPDHVKLPVLNGKKVRWWQKLQQDALAHNSGTKLARVGGGWCAEKNAPDDGCLHTAWLITWAQQFPGAKPIKFTKPPESSEAYETTNWWDVMLDWDDHAARKQLSSSKNDGHFGLYKLEGW